MPFIRTVSYSKSGCSQATVNNVLMDTAWPVCRQVRQFLFSLVFPIYVGKQRYQQSPERNQQCQYPQKNHHNLIIRHQRHLPSGVSPANQWSHRLNYNDSLGGYHPVTGLFCIKILSYLRKRFNQNFEKSEMLYFQNLQVLSGIQ